MRSASGVRTERQPQEAWFEVRFHTEVAQQEVKGRPTVVLPERRHDRQPSIVGEAVVGH